MAFNVSAECGVDWYMLGDLGQNGSMCSQNAEANSIKAYYTAPNILASLKSPGLSNNGVLTGVFGNLGTAGMDMNVVAISYTRGIIPIEVQMPTTFTLVVSCVQSFSSPSKIRHNIGSSGMDNLVVLFSSHMLHCLFVHNTRSRT